MAKPFDFMPELELVPEDNEEGSSSGSGDEDDEEEDDTSSNANPAAAAAAAAAVQEKQQAASAGKNGVVVTKAEIASTSSADPDSGESSNAHNPKSKPRRSITIAGAGECGDERPKLARSVTIAVEDEDGITTDVTSAAEEQQNGTIVQAKTKRAKFARSVTIVDPDAKLDLMEFLAESASSSGASNGKSKSPRPALKHRAASICSSAVAETLPSRVIDTSPKLGGRLGTLGADLEALSSEPAEVMESTEIPKRKVNEAMAQNCSDSGNSSTSSSNRPHLTKAATIADPVNSPQLSARPKPIRASTLLVECATTVEDANSSKLVRAANIEQKLSQDEEVLNDPYVETADLLGDENGSTLTLVNINEETEPRDEDKEEEPKSPVIRGAAVKRVIRPRLSRSSTMVDPELNPGDSIVTRSVPVRSSTVSVECESIAVATSISNSRQSSLNCSSPECCLETPAAAASSIVRPRPKPSSRSATLSSEDESTASNKLIAISRDVPTCSSAPTTNYPIIPTITKAVTVIDSGGTNCGNMDRNSKGSRRPIRSATLTMEVPIAAVEAELLNCGGGNGTSSYKFPPVYSSTCEASQQTKRTKRFSRSVTLTKKPPTDLGHISHSSRAKSTLGNSGNSNMYSHDLISPSTEVIRLAPPRTAADAAASSVLPPARPKKTALVRPRTKPAVTAGPGSSAAVTVSTIENERSPMSKLPKSVLQYSVSSSTTPNSSGGNPSNTAVS